MVSIKLKNGKGNVIFDYLPMAVDAVELQAGGAVAAIVEAAVDKNYW